MASIVLNTLAVLQQAAPHYNDEIEEAISNAVIMARVSVNFQQTIAQQKKEIANLRQANQLMTERLKDCYNEVNPLIMQNEMLKMEVLRLRKMMNTVITRVEQYSGTEDLTLQQKEMLAFLKDEMANKRT